MKKSIPSAALGGSSGAVLTTVLLLAALQLGVPGSVDEIAPAALVLLLAALGGAVAGVFASLLKLEPGVAAVAVVIANVAVLAWLFWNLASSMVAVVLVGTIGLLIAYLILSVMAQGLDRKLPSWKRWSAAVVICTSNFNGWCISRICIY